MCFVCVVTFFVFVFCSINQVNCSNDYRTLGSIDYSERIMTRLNQTIFNNFGQCRFSADDRNSTANFIQNFFSTLGLIVEKRCFFAHTARHGCNVIATLPGQHFKTRKDKIWVIGAHFDTVKSTHGVDDNGSGVAALLQIARLIMKFDQSIINSIIFVSFDLEEVKYRIECQGAILLDSLLNLSTIPSTQTFVNEFKELYPVMYKKVEDQYGMGNYLQLISNSNVNQVSQLIHQTFNKLQIVPQTFKFRPWLMKLDLPNDNLKYSIGFERFSQLYGPLYANTHRSFISEGIDAVLLSDTGSFLF